MADKNLTDISQDLQNIQANLTSMASILGKGIRDSLSDSLTDVENMVNAFEKGKDISKEMESKLIAFQKQSNKLSLEQISIESKLADAQRNRNFNLEKKLTRQLQENKLAQKGIEDQQTLLNNLGKITQQEAKTTEEKSKQRTLLDEAKDKLSGMKNTITDMLKVGSVFDMIWKGLTRANETSVEISKNFGYSAARADTMVMKMQGMALISGQTNMTLKNMAEAMGQLGATTGYFSEFSADTLQTQIMLTKQLGLSGEEAAHIYEMSVLTGKSSSQVNDEMLGAFVNARNAAKVGVSMKQVFAEASKVSGQLQANFAGNPAKITEAIVKTKALGTTLEQTKNQGAKLLDFASSLESELKAELLTGKQLNLERARAAALSGDQVALAEELNKNVGTYDDFSKMNVLQQQALADAVGLTADQLADQLKKQKLAQESGKSLAEITKEEAEKAEKRKTIQDKFNNIVEKLQDIIGSIGTLLSPVVEMFTFIADHSWVIYTALGVMLLAKLPSLVKGFKDMGSSMMGIGKSVKENASKLFSKEGRASLLSGGDKVKETAEKTSETGGKAGAGGAKAGKGIQDTLTGISKGIQSFSKVSPADIGKLALSALALIALTPAIPALLLLQLVNGKLIQGALTGIGKGLAAMGKAMSGAAGEILLAEILLAGLGLALWAFVPIVNAFVPVIQAFGDVILKYFTGIGIVIKAAADGISTLFTSLGGIDIAHLLLIGPALTSVGIGLAALGAGGVISAIGAFLGGDPIKKIERLAASGSGLQAASNGLQGVATALTQVASALSSIDTSKLESLSSFASKMSLGSVVKGITDFITAPVKAVGEAIGGGAEGNSAASVKVVGGAIGGGAEGNNAAMIAAINEVRDAVNKLYTKDSSIHMDGKKVGTTLSQGSHKVA
jgi:hypothetical protein